MDLRGRSGRWGWRGDGEVGKEGRWRGGEGGAGRGGGQEKRRGGGGVSGGGVCSKRGEGEEEEEGWRGDGWGSVAEQSNVLILFSTFCSNYIVCISSA